LTEAQLHTAFLPLSSVMRSASHMPLDDFDLHDGYALLHEQACARRCEMSANPEPPNC
jgi:hypothetical protein